MFLLKMFILDCLIEKKNNFIIHTDAFIIHCIPSNDSLYVTMFGWFNWASTATYKKRYQRN